MVRAVDKADAMLTFSSAV